MVLGSWWQWFIWQQPLEIQSELLMFNETITSLKFVKIFLLNFWSVRGEGDCTIRLYRNKVIWNAKAFLCLNFTEIRLYQLFLLWIKIFIYKFFHTIFHAIYLLCFWIQPPWYYFYTWKRKKDLFEEDNSIFPGPLLPSIVLLFTFLHWLSEKWRLKISLHI